MSGDKKILLLGAGEHCTSVLDSLLSTGDYDEVGIIDKVLQKGEFKKDEDMEQYVLSVPIIGNDNDLEELFDKGYKDAFITVGSVGDVSIRKALYKKAMDIGYRFPNIIDKTSIISPYATMGEGVYVGKNAVINTNARIGNFAIINTSSVIEHNCVISDFVHVAPGSILCGNVFVGEDTHIGSGVKIKQGIQIGSGSMIGMGSVVIKNIGNHVTAYGNPCRER
jgi:sugar O-acyltransferase (sialic acid O-acetyltransferase NeuD family)